MDPGKLTGQQLLQAMADGHVPPASIATTIPMRLERVDKGGVVFVAEADERHLNPLGGVHGGFAATVLDSATGCAVHSALEAGVFYATVDLNLKMLRPVPRGEALTAEAQVTHLSGAIGVAEGTLKGADGTLLASASATCFIRRPQRS